MGKCEKCGGCSLGERTCNECFDLEYEKWYCEYWDAANPGLSGGGGMTLGKGRDKIDFIQIIIDRMNEDEQGWQTVRRVRAKVWRVEDGKKVGEPVHDFEFDPDTSVAPGAAAGLR
ncbi:MAG: hypothetical protein OXI27_08425 [Thaumarchaeota archaeon]|nr:hypothetical protein [Nitrososphaerota archaeon]